MIELTNRWVGFNITKLNFLISSRCITWIFMEQQLTTWIEYSRGTGELDRKGNQLFVMQQWHLVWENKVDIYKLGPLTTIFLSTEWELFISYSFYICWSSVIILYLQPCLFLYKGWVFQALCILCVLHSCSPKVTFPLKDVNNVHRHVNYYIRNLQISSFIGEIVQQALQKLGEIEYPPVMHLLQFYHKNLAKWHIVRINWVSRNKSSVYISYC